MKGSPCPRRVLFFNGKVCFLNQRIVLIESLGIEGCSACGRGRLSRGDELSGQSAVCGVAESGKLSFTSISCKMVPYKNVSQTL